MNSFINSFAKPSATQQSSNLPQHLFQDPKDMNSFPLGIDHATLLSLHSQQPQITIPQYQKMSRHLPDPEDLDPHQSSKKFKSNNGSTHILTEPPKGKIPTFPIQGANKNLIEQQLQREHRAGPDPRQLGLDMQMQQHLFGNNLLNAGFPSIDTLNRGQIPIIPDQNYLAGLGSLNPELLGQKPSDQVHLSEDLSVNTGNLVRDQALRNMLLIQALQNQADVLPNRISALQQQIQLMNNPQLQTLNALRMSGLGGGVNPLLAYQYLEAQKRLETEYATMQARAQMLQAAQRLQNNDWQGSQFSELLDPRRQGGLLLEKLENQVKVEKNKNLEEAKANSQRDTLEKQTKRESNEMDLSNQANKFEVSKKNNILTQPPPQGLKTTLEIKQPQAFKGTNGATQPLKINGQKSDIKKEQPEKMHIEQPKSFVNERIARETFSKNAKEQVRQEVPEIIRRETRETRKSARSQMEVLQKKTLEEERLNKSKERSLRAQRYTQRNEMETYPIAPPPKITPVVVHKPLPEVGIIQPKDKFAKKLKEGYVIEISFLGEKPLTGMKRVPTGRQYQAIIGDCELNDVYKQLEERKRICKLVSKPTHFLGVKLSSTDDIENPYFDPMTKVEGLKEIKVGEPHQASIVEFALNLEDTKHKRLCRLVDSPDL